MKNKKYQILYCGKKLDIVEAKNEKIAIETVRNIINFEAIDYEKDKSDKKKRWLKYHKCPKCKFECSSHKSQTDGTRHWLCPWDRRTYDDDGKFLFRRPSPEDFT